MPRSKNLLIAFSLLVCFFSNSAQAGDTSVIWQATVQDLDIRWTESDITVFKQGDKTPIVSARDLAARDFQQWILENTEKFCTYQRQFTILSVVSTIASFQDTQSLSCQGVPQPLKYSRFIALNLVNGREVKLTDFFTESAIFQALLNDVLIQKNLAQTKKPETLKNLDNILNRQDIFLDDCIYSFDQALTQFAFHHIKKNKITVRLALSPVILGCQATHIERAFDLPIPNSLALALQQAKSSTLGFLMVQMEKIAKARSTTIHFSTVQNTDFSKNIQKDTQVIDEKPLRIVIASGVRVAAEPRSGTKIVGLLPIGTVVEILNRTEKPEIVDNIKEYWYQLKLTNGDIGWLFGSWTRPFEKKQAVAIYRQLAEERLNRDLAFADQVDLTHFLHRVIDEMQAPEIKGEFELLYLLSLKKSLKIINQLEGKAYQSKPYRSWLKEHKSHILSDESVGVFLLDPEVFWNLHDAYYPLPIAEKIAWTAADNAIAGEMGNYLIAILDYLDNSIVKYLKLYPKGTYVEEALNRISDSLDPNYTYFETENTPYSPDELQRLFKVLQRTVAKTGLSKASDIVDKINQLQARIQ